MLKRRFLGIFSAKKLFFSEKLPTFASSFRDTWTTNKDNIVLKSKLSQHNFPIIY